MTSPRATILLLAAVAALGSLGTQLLVPALPLLASDLHAGAGDAQLVIGIYLLGLGAGQLLVGPAADRIGRKPVLLAGLVLYCLGSLGAALAPGLHALLAARLVQALGGSAGIVTARVLVGDLFPREEVAARQATLMGVVLVSPTLAPVIGGLVAGWAGWRPVLLLLALAGLATATLAATALPQPVRRHELPAGLSASYARVLRNPAFVAPAIAVGAGSTCLYMYLGSAPFLLTSRHALNSGKVGLCLMLVAAASMAGTFLVGRIERRADAQFVGNLTILAGAGLMLLLALVGAVNLAAFMLPTIVIGLGAGLAGPAGIARVVKSEPALAGTATSLAGAFQMLSSATGTWSLGRFAPISPLRLGLAEVLVGALACSASGWLWNRRRALSRIPA